ncbi:MAG TPA: site-specific integrase, partial [Thermoanaerobaculia bacterium]
SSVDLKAGFVRVRMSKTKEEAVIPISEELAAAFQSLRFRKDDTGRVFSSGGAAWSWTVLHRYFVLAKKAAGIDRRFRFHDCRHTFASRLASAGVSLQVIAKMLGHTTVQMSQRYARPDEAALKAALAMVKASRIDARIDAQASRADTGAV